MGRKVETKMARVVIFVVLFLAILTGCAGIYGSLRKSGEVKLIFKSFQVLPDNTYHYSGPNGRPDAVKGIYRNHTLQTTQWTQIDLTTDQLKKWGRYFDSNYGTNQAIIPMAT